MADPIVHPFAAQLVELPDSFDAINDYFYDQGWTDGLPIVPPTRERCERDAANRCGWNAEVFECGRVTRGPGGG